MTLNEDKLSELLKEQCSVSTSYPWYGGWSYDKISEDDTFLNSLARGITPEMLSLLRATGATIYPYARIREKFSGQNPTPSKYQL